MHAHDIGMMVTQTPFEYTEYSRPICLPDKNFKIPAGVTCIISGWGTTSKSGTSRELLHSKVKIESRRKCERALHPHTLNADGICSGGSGPAGCSGDRGGPLVCLVQDSRNEPKRYVLGGVTSWGFGCGNMPGVYTSIPMYIDWIKANGYF